METKHRKDFHLNFKATSSDVTPEIGIKPNSCPKTSVCDIEFLNGIRASNRKSNCFITDTTVTNVPGKGEVRSFFYHM